MELFTKYKIRVTDVANIAGIATARASDFVRGLALAPHYCSAVTRAVLEIAEVQEFFSPARVDIRDADNFRSILDDVRNKRATSAK
jgi:hypothetical protein